MTDTMFEIGTRMAMATAASCMAATPKAPCRIDSTRKPLWRSAPCNSELCAGPSILAKRPARSAKPMIAALPPAMVRVKGPSTAALSSMLVITSKSKPGNSTQ